VLALRNPRPVGGEPRRLRLELALPGFQRLGPLECGPLPGGNRLGAAARALLRSMVAAGPPLELCELELACGDRLGALAQRLLQALELGARPVVVGAPRLGELPREP